MGGNSPSDQIPGLATLPLFEGIDPERVPRIMACLNGTCGFYDVGQILLRQEEVANDCLYIVEGRVQLVVSDLQGRRSILCEYRPGEAIAVESFFDGTVLMRADVLAVEPTTVIGISLTREVNAKPCCMEHVRRVRLNLVEALVRTNGSLLRHLAMVSQRTTREKIMTYLTEAADRAGSATFSIPHTRQELADLLYVERSALSHELGKLQSEGSLTFNRSRFTLHGYTLEDPPASGTSRSI